jgi:DNA-binding NarL/FixJ family response regulator
VATRRRTPSPSVPASPARPPISIVVIDDNRLLREGIVLVVGREPDFTVLAHSADVPEALDHVRRAAPDVVLLDFGLEDHDSLDLTIAVHQEMPATRIVVMGLMATQEDLADFVRAGASGFIMKDASFEEFFQTIRKVAAGEEVLPRALTPSLFAQIARDIAPGARRRAREAVQLTTREQEVIALLSEGLSNKQMATRLGVAVHTVKSHVHNVLEKLALHSRLEVAAYSHATARRTPRSD